MIHLVIVNDLLVEEFGNNFLAFSKNFSLHFFLVDFVWYSHSSTLFQVRNLDQCLVSLCRVWDVVLALIEIKPNFFFQDSGERGNATTSIIIFTFHIQINCRLQLTQRVVAR